MAQCKLNKITAVCEKWKRKNVNSELAMQEIKKIVDLKESEMSPCTCAQPQKAVACPSKPQETGTYPMQPEERHTCPMTKSCPICQAAGPMTVNPFFNFMKEMRETTCFNKTVVEVAKEAGDRWSKMSDCDKEPYIVQAYKVSRKKNDDEACAPKRNHSNSSMSGPKAKVRKMK